MTMIRQFKVLISFPDDVDEERLLVREVCADITRAKRDQGVEKGAKGSVRKRRLKPAVHRE
jgi:hypothetical protein